MAKSLRASPEGIKKATTALTGKAWTHDQLAEKLNLCTRWSVSQFFRGKTVKRQTFVEICQKLDLDWQEIAELIPREAEPESEEEEPASTSKNLLDEKFLNYGDDIARSLKENANETIQKWRNLKNMLDALISPSATDEKQKPSHEGRAAFVVVGSISKDDIAKLQAITALLQDLTGDTSIKIVDIEKGSVKLILEGSQQSLEQIDTLFKTGQLTEVLGIPIQDVQFVDSTASEPNKDIKGIEKKRLAFTIAGNISKVALKELKTLLNKTDLKYPKKFSKRVLTDLNEVEEVLPWFEDLYQPSFSRRVWADCELVLVEGLVNVVRRAHSHLPPSVPIDIEVTLFSNSLEIRIWDQGPPFNLKEAEKDLRIASTFTEELEFSSLLQMLGGKFSYIRTKDNRNCFLYQSSTSQN